MIALPRFVLLPLLLCLVAPRASGAAEEIESITACVRQNLPEQSSQQSVEFRSRDRVGSERLVEGTVWWKRFDDGFSRVLVRLASPEDLRGAGLLMIEKKSRSDMFLYLPDLRKVRRVTQHMLSGSLFGSDFTYEDFEQLQGISMEGERKRLADTTLDEAPVYVLAHYPAPEAGSSYERVVSYVDKQTCLVLKSEMWEPGDRLRKVLTIDRARIFEKNGLRIPQVLLMKDVLNETETRLVFDDIDVEARIPKKVFSLSRLERPQAR